MNLRIVRRGRWTVYAVCTERGDCPLLSFLQEGEPKGWQSKEKGRMLARLASVAEDGPPRNAEACHQVDDEIWQLEQGRVRVLWFYDEGRVVVLSHGFLKSSRKTPEREKRTARAALKRYRDAKRRGEIRLLEDRG